VAFRPLIAQGLALTFNTITTTKLFYKKTVIARSGAIGGEAEANPEIPCFKRINPRNVFIFKKGLRMPQAAPKADSQ
jgi:hypothetical protein